MTVESRARAAPRGRPCAGTERPISLQRPDSPTAFLESWRAIQRNTNFDQVSGGKQNRKAIRTPTYNAPSTETLTIATLIEPPSLAPARAPYIIGPGRVLT